jgi:hypothetical protein
VEEAINKERINPDLARRVNVEANGWREVVACALHGELTPGSYFFVSYHHDDGDKVHYYCLRCLTGYLDALMSEGILPRVSIKNEID